MRSSGGPLFGDPSLAALIDAGISMTLSPPSDTHAEWQRERKRSSGAIAVPNPQ
jgi:hypothetical protein